MERRRWILAVIGIVVTIVIVAVLLFILLQGMISWRCPSPTVDLHHPVSVGENVWIIEIKDVTVTEDCPRDLEHFGVALQYNESTIALAHQLRNGLVTQADTILIFFADQGEVGRLDAGDLFYLVNLELESQYDFYVLDAGAAYAGHVPVYT